MSLPKNQRKVFLKSFFGGNLFREFRILNPDNRKNKRFFLKKDTKQEEHFLLNQVFSCDNGDNNIYAELYGFFDWDNHLLNQSNLGIKKEEKKTTTMPVRLYDRLYFDFDLDNEKIKELKNRINKTIIDKDNQHKSELLEEYHSLLLDSEIARKPFMELQKLYNYLKNKEILSFPVFSGSKGFHLYIFFTPSLFNPDGFNNVAGDIFRHFKSTLGFETLDQAVFQNPSQRISRLPYTRHPITELYTYPISIGDSYELVIGNAFNPQISSLNINNYINANGNHELLDFLKMRIVEEVQELTRQEDLLQRLNLVQKKKRLQKVNSIYGEKKYKELLKDCRVIAEHYLGSPVRVFGDYVLYRCCFHSDKHPSLSVYKEGFICGGCGAKGNYLDFIMEYYGVDKDEAIKILISLS